MDDLERRVQETMKHNLEPITAFPLAADRMRSASRMRMVATAGAALLAISLVAGVGLVAPRLGGERAVPTPATTPPADAPDVAMVRCTDAGAEAEVRTVEAQPDGVHIRVANETGLRQFFLWSPEDAVGHNEGGRIEPHGVTDLTTSAPPGDLVIGCFAGDRDIPYFAAADPRFAPLDVVDPEGLWAPLDLVCGPEFERSRIGLPAREDADSVEAVRTHVPGLEPSDRLETPGYPGTEWHFEPRVVIRNDRRVARLTFVKQGGWQIQIEACVGSGIGGA